MSAGSQVIPTATVQSVNGLARARSAVFFEGTTSVENLPLNSSGQPVWIGSPVAVGLHSLNASFPGNAFCSASTPNIVKLMVITRHSGMFQSRVRIYDCARGCQ